MNPDYMEAELSQEELERTVAIRKVAKASIENLAATIELMIEQSDMMIPEISAAAHTLSSLKNLAVTMNINEPKLK
jgi:rRNA maturation endonuclease Nob1